MSHPEGYRAGIVAVLGKPNVGKSTLVNTIVGQKVSIVSNKAQTTRKRALGIATRPKWQMAFVDTPGMHKAQHALGRSLNEAARSAMHGPDCLLIMVDVSKMPGREDENLARTLQESGQLESTPSILCMNKMDLLRAKDVERHHNTYLELFPCQDSMMTSLTRGENVQKLISLLVERMPESPPLYPPDEVTDQPERFLVAELIREKALRATRQEVPHALACRIENWEDDGKIVHISAVLMVERDGQKAIIIGKKGSMLKRIGTEARADIEHLLGKKVFLETFVQVREGWRTNPRLLREFDYM